MGDDYAPSPVETTKQQLQAFTQFLPGLMEAINAQMLPNEQAQLNTSRVVSPQFAELQADILDTSGRRLNTIGQEIQRGNALAGAVQDRDVLKGPGREVVQAGLDISRLADPEFFANREGISNALAPMLTGQLSGSERAEIERSLARDRLLTGNTVTTGTNTVAAAQQFGNASNDKMRQAIAQATAFLPASLSGVDPFLQAVGRSGFANTGDNKFIGARQQAGQQSAQIGSQFLGETGQTARQANQINANRTTGLDRAIQGVQAVGSVIGGIVPG